MTGKIKVGDTVSYKVRSGGGELLRIESGEVIGIGEELVTIRVSTLIDDMVTFRDKNIEKADVISEREKPKRFSIGEGW